VSEHWSDVVTSTSSGDELCCRVLYRDYRLQRVLNQTTKDVMQEYVRNTGSLVDKKRTSSWYRLTTNAQSFVADAAGSRPNDRLQ